MMKKIAVGVGILLGAVATAWLVLYGALTFQLARENCSLVSDPRPGFVCRIRF
jgi:hypothetical protein